MKRLIVALALFASACGDGPVTPSPGPNDNSPLKTPVASPPPVITPSPPPVTSSSRITGPLGCLDAKTLPPTITWTIKNVPLNAKIDKAYAQDDTAGCGATIENLITQNDHLRFGRETPTSPDLSVRFDRDTYHCGHAQVDISIDGVNVLGVPINYGRNCDEEENVCVPETSFDWYDFGEPINGTMTATFSAREEAVGHRIFLTSFGVPKTSWPRVRTDETVQPMTLGPNTITVKLAPKTYAGWQVKLACIAGPLYFNEGFYSHDNLLDGRSGEY